MVVLVHSSSTARVTRKRETKVKLNESLANTIEDDYAYECFAFFTALMKIFDFTSVIEKGRNTKTL